MGNIVLLDDLTINKIAAGEVIERPANVVKELVENSLDAGATHIIVEIKNGGKTLIKVTDNGKGISKDDMPISIERHATSKIRKVEDLENTYTMGFRGEALASISAISKMTMISKTLEETTGYKIQTTAGNVIDIEECGAQTGTTIIVEKLFFNTPVRYKFLKQDATENKYIKEWVYKVALANPQVSFKLISDGKQVFSSNGNGKIEDIIYLLYGKEIKENLVKVDYEENNIKITGVVGNTMVARDTRKDQIIFLNKRHIQNVALMSSADQAFKGATGIGKYGFYILNLEMPANYYDVNVHPTKIEVRFNEEHEITRILYHAIKNSILNSEFLGNNQNENKEKYIENEFEFLTTNKIESNGEFNKTSKFDLPKADMTSLKIKENTEKNIENSDLPKVENQNIELRKREEKRKVEYKYIGILFRTYIIVEIADEIYLIDQHAAHERVLYEQIKENYKNHIEQNSQLTLIPEVVNLTHKEMEFVKENMKLFRDIGFDIEEFGENTLKINGIPDLEYRAKTNNIFLDILDEMLSNERTSVKDVEERFIATVACKAAVKANMDLKEKEVDDLIQSLLSLNNPYTCPHGRPTTIKISKEYLEEHLGK